MKKTQLKIMETNTIRGIKHEVLFDKSKNFKTNNWYFAIKYCDLIDGKEVWRNIFNYVSNYFPTKKAAKLDYSNYIQFLETLKQSKYNEKQG